MNKSQKPQMRASQSNSLALLITVISVTSTALGSAGCGRGPAVTATGKAAGQGQNDSAGSSQVATPVIQSIQGEPGVPGAAGAPGVSPDPHAVAAEAAQLIRPQLPALILDTARANPDVFRGRDGRDGHNTIQHDCAQTIFNGEFPLTRVAAQDIVALRSSNGVDASGQNVLPYELHHTRSSRGPTLGHLDLINMGDANVTGSSASSSHFQPDHVENAMVMFEVNLEGLPPKASLRYDLHISTLLTVDVEKSLRGSEQNVDGTESICSLDLRLCSGTPLISANFSPLRNTALFRWVNNEFGDFVEHNLAHTSLTPGGQFIRSLSNIFGAPDATGINTGLSNSVIFDKIYEGTDPENQLASRRLRFIVSDDTRVTAGKLALTFTYDSCNTVAPTTPGAALSTRP